MKVPPRLAPLMLAPLLLMATSCGTTSTSSTTSSLVACQITDTAGIHDKGFHQLTNNALMKLHADYGVTVRAIEPKSSGEFGSSIDTLVQGGCGVVVGAGFLLGDAILAAAKKYPDHNFVIVDVCYDPTNPLCRTEGPISNIQGIFFQIDQAAFLAGYLAAGASKTGKVGEWGGINIPPVALFMDGFWAGVEYYNKQKSKTVKVLGWDPATKKGLFTGDFSDTEKGRAVTASLISEGADMILTVGGGAALGAATAAQQAGSGVGVIPTDLDACVSNPSFCSVYLTTIVKNIDTVVYNSIKPLAQGKAFSGGTYVGNLQDGGIGIAPLHDWQSKVPASLIQELDTVRAGIIGGTIDVKPSAYTAS